MKNIIDFLCHNYAWILSGSGVVIIRIVFNYFFKKKKKTKEEILQNIKNVNNSNINQIGKVDYGEK